MAVKIRLSRRGKKHVPFFSIVAVDERKKRDGAYLENLGTYDALKSEIVTINQDRVSYWISVGAVPTDAFLRINKAYKKTQAASGSPAPADKKPKSSASAQKES